MKILKKLINLMVFIVSFIVSYNIFSEIYNNQHSKILEKGDKPEHFFIIVEYFEETKEYKEKWLYSENYKQELDKYLKENGNKRLFLPENYSKEEGSRGDVGYVKKNYSILEKTKEYELIEIYSEIPDDDITTRYKVYYDGKVVPTFSFFDKYMLTTRHQLKIKNMEPQ